MRCPRLRRASLTIVLGCLTSCAAAGSSGSLASNACAALPLASYTRAQQDKVADELAAAQADAAWPGFVADYGRLRAAVRACQETHLGAGR